MEMRRKVLNAAFVALLATAILGTLGLSFARADDDDNGWKGPGWYQVFYGTGVYLIYSGPYADQDACNSYVQQRLADEGYMKEMYQKYGTYGDHDHGFDFYCVTLNSKTELPD
jgi:hypothetical protein